MTVEVPPPSPGRLVGELGTPVRGSICLNAGQWISTDTEGRFMIPGGTSNAVGLARDLTGTRARLFWWKDASSAGQEIHVERLAVLTARIVDGYGNPAGSATPASFYFLTPGIQAAPYYAIEPLGFRSRLVSGRFRFEVPTGLPLQVEVVAAGAGSGESELINPMPGQTYDLGDIVLGPHSSPKP
jgi:hypothetical protein